MTPMTPTTHPSPHCTTIDEVLAFEAHAKAFAARVAAELAITTEPMPDGRIRYTATHPERPEDMAHDYLPADASPEAVAKVKADLARRWASHAATIIDTPEAKAARQTIVREHRKRQAEQRRKEAEEKAARAGRVAIRNISGPGIPVV